MCRVAVLSLLLGGAAAQVAAQCSADDACTGRQVTLANGSCATARSMSDDGVACTTDVCSPLGIYTIKSAAAGCLTCASTCPRDCEGKDCGNDGCGGFCGVCSEDQGCGADFKCTSNDVVGSCTRPISLGEVSGSSTLTVQGNTGQAPATHTLTPLCNFRSASPELIYTFTIPGGKVIGYDIRTTGYDTVLSLMRGQCRTNATVSCNDDATPPGDYGSAISGLLKAGTYFVQVDGYDSAANGPFDMTLKFVDGCQPKCDGAWCGSDSCGGSCGTCAAGQVCDLAKARCWPVDCQPKCGAAYNRTCGEDGCGGSCGACGAGRGCVHASIVPDEDEFGNLTSADPPASYCKDLPTCDHRNPTCADCAAGQYCASDCTCRDPEASLPDLIVLDTDARDDMWLHQLDVTNTSCQVTERCVGGTGLRNLLRFTASATNQGQADFVPPEPKDTPETFMWGSCHQHYHFINFMSYQLLDRRGAMVQELGQKAAFCMEDSRRILDGPGVPCEKKYDCGSQGLSRGWADTYGWSLDCSWLDVTGIPAGTYYLRIDVNPDRRIAESSYANNVVCIRVDVPDSDAFTSIPTHVEGNEIVDCGILSVNERPEVSWASRAPRSLLGVSALAAALTA